MKLRALALAAALLSCFPASGLPGVGSFRTSAAPSPNNPMAGRAVTFTVTAAVPDGLVSNVVICFGDGSCDAEGYTWETQERLNACLLGSNYSFRFFHTYVRPGSFAVSLAVEAVGCPGMAGSRQSSGYWLNVG